MNTHRFHEAARTTNYEMSALMAKGYWRGRWLLVWADLANDFHPVSIEDWIKHNEE
jgi:hypothetical protein